MEPSAISEILVTFPPAASSRVRCANLKLLIHFPAVLRNPNGRSGYVSLPIGAVLTSLGELSSPVIGTYQVICEQRQYALLGADLLPSAIPVRASKPPLAGYEQVGR